MSGINLRMATAEDVAVVHRLLLELEKSLGATDQVERQEQDLLHFGFSQSSLFKALVAWRGAEAVGLALYFPEFSSWRGRPGVYVQDLYVSEKLRGTGLGRVLMEAVYADARQWGATYCRLSAHFDNDAAIAFYQRLGFKVADNERVLVLDGL